jgi:hypothetical protein
MSPVMAEEGTAENAGLSEDDVVASSSKHNGSSLEQWQHWTMARIATADSTPCIGTVRPVLYEICLCEYSPKGRVRGQLRGR